MDQIALLIMNTFLLILFTLIIALISLLAIKKAKKEQRDTINSLKKQISEEQF